MKKNLLLLNIIIILLLLIYFLTDLMTNKHFNSIIIGLLCILHALIISLIKSNNQKFLYYIFSIYSFYAKICAFNVNNIEFHQILCIV